MRNELVHKIKMKANDIAFYRAKQVFDNIDVYRMTYAEVKPLLDSSHRFIAELEKWSYSDMLKAYRKWTYKQFFGDTILAELDDEDVPQDVKDNPKVV